MGLGTEDSAVRNKVSGLVARQKHHGERVPWGEAVYFVAVEKQSLGTAPERSTPSSNRSPVSPITTLYTFIFSPNCIQINNFEHWACTSVRVHLSTWAQGADFDL
ncbi:hypothetical protein H920_13311 [Fukomys damarensis]|uniref:Uncharacterized protein n=1 Tax=Fukomys damarensis TaxID=885580 RepID=A0A091D468_FUKDA|nr:hypothetical protein H920_13311 [Fukomys damarensis]